MPRPDVVPECWLDKVPDMLHQRPPAMYDVPPTYIMKDHADDIFTGHDDVFFALNSLDINRDRGDMRQQHIPVMTRQSNDGQSGMMVNEGWKRRLHSAGGGSDSNVSVSAARSRSDTSDSSASSLAPGSPVRSLHRPRGPVLSSSINRPREPAVGSPIYRPRDAAPCRPLVAQRPTKQIIYTQIRDKHQVTFYLTSASLLKHSMFINEYRVSIGGCNYHKFLAIIENLSLF